MTFALVDDSNTDIEILYQHLCRYCQTRKVHMHIEKFTDEIAFLKSMRNTRYNLVFLDIYMKKATGIQIAKKNPGNRSQMPDYLYHHQHGACCKSLPAPCSGLSCQALQLLSSARRAGQI